MIEGYQNLDPIIMKDNQKIDESDAKIEDIIIEEKKEIEEKVTDDALIKENPNYFARLFDRFYFSIVTGTTLGYGDIYPDSKLSKTLVIIELLVSAVIVFLM